MLAGINSNWKIPLTYNFCKSSTSGVQLTRCIKELVRAITTAGFKLVATVCDQGQTNASCLNSLVKNTRSACIKEKRFFCKCVCVCARACVCVCNVYVFLGDL